MSAYGVWTALVGVRILLCLWPMSGYIHPDEFFQNTEPLAGDILGVEAFRPWEFNASRPLRSVLLPHLTTGAALTALRAVAGPRPSPRALLALPRLAMGLLSLLALDLPVYKICRLLGWDAGVRLLILASSYAALVVQTRTFSNAYEAAAFALLLWAVVDSRLDQFRPGRASPSGKEEEEEEGKREEEEVKEKEEKDKKEEKGKKEEEKKDAGKEDEKEEGKKEKNKKEEEKEGKEKEKKEKGKKTEKKGKEKKEEEFSSGTASRPSRAFWIGVLVVAGTFNRITFPCFCLIPLVFWATGSASQFGGRAARELLANSLALLPGALAALLAHLAVDSLYYGSLDPSVLAEPGRLLSGLVGGDDFLRRNLTLAPLNSLLYHLDVDNIAQHGLHPRVTHLLVNLPMLFLPLVVCFGAELLSLAWGRGRGRQEEPTASTGLAGSSSRAFLALCTVTPVFLLSLVPHQEPRFLLPLLVPLVLLYAEYVVAGPSLPNAPWILWNVLGCLMFGFVHQAGVVPAVMHTHTLVSQAARPPIQYHFVFYHTYMPPRHLAAYDQSAGEGEDDRLPNTAAFHDLMGAGSLTLSRTVSALLSPGLTPAASPYRKEVYVLAPASQDPAFCRLGVKQNYRLVRTFFPHVSAEDLPEFLPGHGCAAEPERSYRLKGPLQAWRAMLSLNMYRAEVASIGLPPGSA